MTVDDLVILGILNNLVDVPDSAINVAAHTADNYNVRSSSIASLRTDLDGQSSVLPDDTVKRLNLRRLANKNKSLRVQSSSTVTNDGIVPTLVN
jgi:hypothetical protein